MRNTKKVKNYTTDLKELNIRVELIRDGNKCGPTITKPSEIVEYVKDLRKRDREVLLCAHLSSRNSILGIETVSIGTLDASLVHPRELYKSAILANAARVLIIHNHPSGCSEFSKDDIEITKRISDAGKIIGIELIDHIVLGADDYQSAKEKGLLEGK